jgi:transcriptional regulator with GAF, ATPase, and Fis domain
MLAPEDLPDALFETGDLSSSSVTGYHDALMKAKRSIVIKAIEEAQGNYTEAAKRLGLHPTNLHRLIRNLDLKESLLKK